MFSHVIVTLLKLYKTRLTEVWVINRDSNILILQIVKQWYEWIIMKVKMVNTYCLSSLDFTMKNYEIVN